MHKLALLISRQLRSLHNLIVPQAQCVVDVESNAFADPVRGSTLVEAALFVGTSLLVGCFCVIASCGDVS